MILKNGRLLLKDIKENVQHIVLLYVEDCVVASRNISMFFKECAPASERYQWTTASERKKYASFTITPKTSLKLKTD